MHDKDNDAGKTRPRRRVLKEQGRPGLNESEHTRTPPGNATVDLATLERRLSPERLAPYRAAAGDLASATELYAWNATVAAAFWIDLGVAEVVLRNAMRNELTAWTATQAGRDGDGLWYHSLTSVLSPESGNKIRKAEVRVQAAGKIPTPGQVVATLTLGFWRFLVSGRYHRTLWQPCLHSAFPHHRQPRRQVHQTLARLHDLRNRIAHHEPIHNRDLAARHADVLTVVGWICPDTYTWLASSSLVPYLLTTRPGQDGTTQVAC